MLAGDGGDETGGNTRYAKQKAFEAYFRLLRRPNRLDRTHRASAGCEPYSSAAQIRSYVDQANVRPLCA
jgi:hypothetical protein